MSTAVFKTFACNDNVVEGESYLRVDYSLSCKSRLHTFFRVYAMHMIVVRGLPRRQGETVAVDIECNNDIFSMQCIRLASKASLRKGV